MKFTNLTITYDDSRNGYYIIGDGFDFFLYLVSNYSIPEFKGYGCDFVYRAGYGNGYVTKIYIPILQDPIDTNILLRAVNRSLSKHEQFFKQN